MALAILRFEGVEDGRARFDVELGRNAWYTYAIGGGERESVHGIEILADPAYTSPLIGPLPPGRRRRATLEVPVERFDRENRHMQLMSFRTEEQEGPAVSEIVRVPIGGWRQRQTDGVGSSARPSGRVSAASRAVVPFRLVEATSRKGLSTAMFWQALVGMLPQIIPMVAPLVSNLFGGLFGGGSRGGGSSGGGAGAGGVASNFLGQIGGLLERPEIQRLIADVVQRVAAPSGSAGGAAPLPPTPTGAPAGASGNAGSSPLWLPGASRLVPDARARIINAGIRRGAAAEGSLSALVAGRSVATGGYVMPIRSQSPLSRAQFVDGGVISGPMIAGLVSSVLPALMPLLEKLANPETLNTILTHASPERSIGAITDIIMDPNRRQFERLWQHTPEVGPSALPALLMQMGAAAAKSPVPTYRRVEAVSLSFEGLIPITVYGTSRVAYRAGRDLSFSISVATPKPIKEAVLHWQVKHPITRETRAHGTVAHDRVESGLLAPLTIPSGALASLPTNEDYMLCATLLWRTKKGERIGTRRSVMIALVGEYMFDRVEENRPDVAQAEETTEPIPLNDAQTYREFWHKVWEGPFTSTVKTHRVECKYFYALEDRRDVARMETLEKRVKGEGGRPMTRLKTGLLMSPGALNALVPSLSDEPALDADQLAALRAPDFRARFAQAALARVTLRGRAGERAALWVYPEVKMQHVVLKRAAVISDSGQVTEYSEVRVRFPMPALAHFIGARTER